MRNGRLLALCGHEKQTSKVEHINQTKQTYDGLHDCELAMILCSIEEKCELNWHIGYGMWATWANWLSNVTGQWAIVWLKAGQRPVKDNCWLWNKCLLDLGKTLPQNVGSWRPSLVLLS